MENASKALLMAGGILISLLVISLLYLMFNNLSSYQDSQDQATKEAQIVSFNNQFTTFDRSDVRGSELYTIMNKTIDYNKRKSSLENTEIAYEPMTVNIIFTNTDQLKKFTKDDVIRIFTNDIIGDGKVTQSSTSKEFEDKVSKAVDKIEDTYGANNLTKLVTAFDKIFISENNPTDKEKIVACLNYNKIAKGEIPVTTASFNTNLSKDGNICKAVLTYYEYINFKRGIFNCTNCSYNKNTGRVTQMDFTFTGNLE